MYVRCSACGLSRGPPRAAELFSLGTSVPGNHLLRHLEVLVFKGNSSNCFSLLFGRIECTEGILPSDLAGFMEVGGMLIEFFQIYCFSGWKNRLRRGDSSKDHASAFGRTGLAEPILPKITSKQLEVQASQRRFFQRSCLSIWKSRLRRRDSSKDHSSVLVITYHYLNGSYYQQLLLICGGF